MEAEAREKEGDFLCLAERERDTVFLKLVCRRPALRGSFWKMESLDRLFNLIELKIVARVETTIFFFVQRRVMFLPSFL